MAGSIKDWWNWVVERCKDQFPCVSDPARRSALVLKVALVGLHLVYPGVLFLLDGDLIIKTKEKPWYTALYLLLFIAALVQYFFTAGSSPGYVLDAMRVSDESDALYRRYNQEQRQSALSNNGSLPITMDGCQFHRNRVESNMSSWTKLVMSMYPPGTSIRTLTCPHCNIIQPPRSRHCQDCDKCVLRFDHHCVWLGTCIGQRNHSRFWWYILEETALCLWTETLYTDYLKSYIMKLAWWKDAFIIMLLISLSFVLLFLLLLLLFHSYLILTNQTTYELVRRRRIPYLREIPDRIYPFSNGICHNLYNFCCPRSTYFLEPLPRAHEIEAKIRPYTCIDILSCRCC